MGKLRDILAKVKASPAMEEVILNLVKNYEEEILNFNRAQLQDSIDANGEPLGEYRSIAYANLKGRITVDLKLTGDFYGSFFLQADQFPILFNAADSKTFELKAKYGNEILGLTKSSKDGVAQEIIKPKLQEYIRQLIKV